MLNHVKYRSKFADAEQAEQALDALTGAGSPEKTELHTVLESIMKRMPDKRAQVF